MFKLEIISKLQTWISYQWWNEQLLMSKYLSYKYHIQMTFISGEQKVPPLPNQQEAHGPHIFQINKHIWIYHNIDKVKKKPIVYFMRIEWFFIWTNLNFLHPRMLCAK